MLRVKRSIQAMYNTQFTAHLIAQQTQQGKEAEAGREVISAVVAQGEETVVKPPAPKRPDQVAFVRGDTLLQPQQVVEKVANPEEIALDDEDDEDEADEGNGISYSYSFSCCSFFCSLMGMFADRNHMRLLLLLL